MYNKGVFKSFIIFLMLVVKFKKNVKFIIFLFILNLKWLLIRNICILVLFRDILLSRYIFLW